MKFTVAAALFSVAASAATTEKSLPELFSRIPQCANQCIADAMPGLCPSVESYWCRCHNSVKGRLMSKTFDCAMEACGGMQQALEYQEIANSVCDDIMEVTLQGQKHVELRAVGSGSVAPSGASTVRGSASGSRALSSATTIVPASTTPTAAKGAASTVGPSSFGAIAFGSVAGLAIISAFGMLL